MNLMIVDDSPLIQELLRKAILKIYPTVRILQATNCSEAREAFHATSPQVVLLDIALPDGNGINLLEEFRKTDNNLPILMVTACTSPEIRKKCMDSGATRYFDKQHLTDLIKYLSVGKN